ncbi:DUF58 domain-containing protein [Alicyclobacillus fastidiosus]|uniref:DUF58 domain-containing protein n=1 Tax=Alicyclobacillus fastidiosus TaxID=392011 RepID=A0ABV5AJ31_9BACL|nr:DUF58 domain-containing protein [Alicyclobacillus fastidiosus]WEH11168.1 DUF58 domain-containing protein [Alicyclobacillus fastidiosus]
MLTVLWLVFVVAVMIWVWPRWWASVVQDKVDCIVDFPRHECDIGEALPLKVTLVNRSWLPIPFAEVHVNLPHELSTLQDDGAHQLVFATYVLMRRRVQIEFTLYGFHRGPAAVKDVVVRMHEGIGLRNTYVYDQPIAKIAVRPNPDPCPNRPRPVANQGEKAVDRWLFPDETMFKGVRPYQESDPARHIHWRASARLGRLVAKQFFSSTELDVLLILNAQTTEPHWKGSAREPFEELIGYLTDVALSLERVGARLSFASNASVVGRRGVALPSQLSGASLRSLLGHAQPYATESLGAILSYLLKHRQSTPHQVILFSAFETDDQTKLVNQLRRSGRQIDFVRAVRHPLETADAVVDPVGPAREVTKVGGEAR